MFQGRLKNVSRKCKGSFLKISRVVQESFRRFQVRLKGVSSSFKVFEGSIEGLSGVRGSFSGVSRAFQGSFKSVPRKFQGYFKNVSR